MPPGLGPAPPLPSGPPPAYGPPQDQQANHQAAWAAYYQSQGMGGATGYNAAGTSQQPAQPSQPAPNPYANYGYGAGAQLSHTAGQHRPPGQAQGAYRPSAPPPYTHATPQAQPYGPQQPYNPQAPSYGQGGYQAQAQQGAYAGGFAQPGQAQQAYRPPAGAQQGYNAQQAYYPQQAGPQPPQGQYSPAARPQANQPFRPSQSPSPIPPQNRPYQPAGPANRMPSGPGRPPQAPNAGFPPAKRPRFDSPQAAMAGPAAPVGPVGQGIHGLPHAPMQSYTPPRPQMPVRPVGPNAGQPGFVTRPIPGPVHTPNGPSSSRAPSSSLPAPPVPRPPIHLGLGGPPPSLPFGGQIRGGLGGGMMRGGMAARGGRGGLMNAPRGPAGMRRPDATRSRDADKRRRDKDRDRDHKEKEPKTTMSDFRIVGIEMKEIGWSWGVLGDLTDNEEEVKVEETKSENREPDSESSDSPVKEEKTAEVAAGAEESAEVEVKPEPELAEPVSEPVTAVDSSETAETVEEKRGAKRKAKTPEGEDEGSASKKRSGEYILTHGKPNDSSSASRDSNQNRFRIYFESPPELDRIPKALRRNPNKRWRREESGSVAPSVVDTAREGTVGTMIEAVEEEKGEDADAAETVVDESEEAAKVGEATVVEVGEDTDAVEKDANAGDALTLGTGSAEAADDSLAPQNKAPSSSSVEISASTAEVEASAPSAGAPTTDTAADGSNGPADVSMATDPGTIESAINDLVDQAAAEAILTEGTGGEPTAIKGQDNDTATEWHDGKLPTDPTVARTETAPGGQEDTQVNGTAENPVKAESESSPSKQTAEDAQALADSAENTASAYKTRARRRSSVSSTDTNDYPPDSASKGSGPSLNRLSILYEESSRRLCFDADVVEKVKIHRKEGKIEVHFVKDLHSSKESDDAPMTLPRGILVETYDSTDQRFVSSTLEKLEEVWSSPSETNITVPPLHKALSSDVTQPLVFTVYLNMKKPLSEPKWCRNNSADEWLIEQFGTRKASSASGWTGKLEIVDPDPAPTLQSILDSWVSSASYGTTQSRKAFTSSLLSDPNDLVEILLRLARGDRNPTASTSSTLGPLATAVRPDSPYASHQTHVSLAILAMYRLTTDYAAKAGEKSEVVNEKVNDIIKSLPPGMIHKSLEGLFREWGTGGKSSK